MSLRRPRAVGITPMETRRDVMLHIATRADDLGYSTLYVAEGWSHDVSVLMTEIALRTNRINIASGVLNIWGRSAATIAMLAASLSSVSAGRFVLGLGAGSRALAEGLHGIPFRSPIRRLEDVTRDVQSLLRGDRAVSAPLPGTRPLKLGMHRQFDVPIHLAALGAQSMRLCGELADAWFPFLLPVSAVRGRLPLLALDADEGSRAMPLVCPGIPAAISSDPAVARRLATWWITFYLTKMGSLYPNILCDSGYSRAVAAVQATASSTGDYELPAVARILIDDLTLCGNAESARTALDGWYRVGADVPVIMLPPNAEVEELNYMLDAMRPW